MLLNQQHQSDVSGLTPMPIDNIDDTSTVNIASAETVVWSYNNSGAWGVAGGQAAGTIVISKLSYTGVLNSNGSALGCYEDTSLSWGAATRVSSLIYIPEEAFSKMANMTVAEKVAYVATWLTTNGQYAIDHRRGEVWAKPKAIVANDAATYKYATTLTGGGSGDKVDVIKLGGEAVPTDNGPAGATPKVLMAGGIYKSSDDTYDDNDAVPVHFDVGGWQHVRDKAYDSSTQSNKVAEISPLSSQYVNETLIDETNITTNTTTYAYFDMDGFRNFSLQGETSGTAPTDVLTVTLEATNQDDGTAAASCAYQDVTNALFGVASWVDTDFMAIADTPQPFKYVRVKYVTSNGGGGDADLTVYLKKLY